MAVEEARRRGAETLQIFFSNPRAWRPSLVTAEADAELVDERKKAGIEPMFLHAPYLVNLASPDLRTRTLSAGCVRRGLERAQGLDAAVVVHGGSALGGSRTAAIRRQARAILSLLGGGPAGPRRLLEMTTGAPGHLVSRFPEAARMLDACAGHARLGVCVDTCHLFAAGYDLSTAPGVEALVDELCAEIGRERLWLVHANDARDPCGSRRDRHWHVGKGSIGPRGFAALVAEPRLVEVPFICETPGDEDDDRRNIRYLKRLRTRSRI